MSHDIDTSPGKSVMDDDADEKDDVKRKSRNLSEKKRRDQFNLLINELSTMVASNNRKMDKSTVLKATIAFLKNQKEHSIRPQSNEIREDWKPSFLSNEEFTHLMLEALDGFIMTVSCSGQVLYTSESITPLIGHLPSDLSGKPLYDLMLEEEQDEMKRFLSNPALAPAPTSWQDDTKEKYTLAVHLKKATKNASDELLYERVHLTGYFERYNCPSEDGVLEFSCSEAEDSVSMSSRSVSVTGSSVFGQPQPLLQQPTQETTKLVFVAIARMERPQLEREMMIIEPSKTEFTSRHSLEWKFLFLDHRAPTIIGYMPFEVLGTSGYDYYHVEDLEKVAECHEQLMKTGKGTSCYYRFLTKGQQWIWLQTQYYITYHQWNSKPEFIVCTNTVISYSDVKAELLKDIKESDKGGVDGEASQGTESNLGGLTSAGPSGLSSGLTIGSGSLGTPAVGMDVGPPTPVTDRKPIVQPGPSHLPQYPPPPPPIQPPHIQHLQPPIIQQNQQQQQQKQIQPPQQAPQQQQTQHLPPPISIPYTPQPVERSPVPSPMPPPPQSPHGQSSSQQRQKQSQLVGIQQQQELGESSIAQQRQQQQQQAQQQQQQSLAPMSPSSQHSAYHHSPQMPQHHLSSRGEHPPWSSKTRSDSSQYSGGSDSGSRKRARVQQQQQQIQQQQQQQHEQQQQQQQKQLHNMDDLAPPQSPCSDISANSHVSHTSLQSLQQETGSMYSVSTKSVNKERYYREIKLPPELSRTLSGSQLSGSYDEDKKEDQFLHMMVASPTGSCSSQHSGGFGSVDQQYLGGSGGGGGVGGGSAAPAGVVAQGGMGGGAASVAVGGAPTQVVQVAAVPFSPVFPINPVVSIQLPTSSTTEGLRQSLILSPDQRQLQEQLRRKHAELQQQILRQQEELRQVNDQLIMSQYGSLSVPVHHVYKSGVQYTTASTSINSSGGFHVTSAGAGVGVGAGVASGGALSLSGVAGGPGVSGGATAGTVTLTTEMLGAAGATPTLVQPGSVTSTTPPSPAITVSTFTPTQVSLQGSNGQGMSVPYQLSHQQAQMLFTATQQQQQQQQQQQHTSTLHPQNHQHHHHLHQHHHKK